MSPALRRRVASIITTLIMGFILYKVLERMVFVVWVQVPWWGLIILGILLFLVVDYMVNRTLGVSKDGSR
jgi:uncharacterized membrane protein